MNKWLGAVDCLGYLICRGCAEAGHGRRPDGYVYGPPHSAECCDVCGYLLTACHAPPIKSLFVWFVDELNGGNR